MIKRNELEKKLLKYISNIDSRDERQDILDKLKQQYNIPVTISSDIITMRRDLSEFEVFILYAVTSIVKPTFIDEYFTKRDVDIYKNKKYKIKKLELPIRLNMLEVAPDQWVGASSAQFLMDLRSAQLINYNADTQRAFQVIVNDGKEIYRPSIDATAVKEIFKAYQDRTFIPNTISLNINDDNNDTELNYEDGVLTIYPQKGFDIFDGYHRYLAISQAYDLDNNFDYPIELRITRFSTSRAKQFIWQEDHKTKMRKIDAHTYDQRNPGNMVIDRINNNIGSNLMGKINLTDGLINYGYLSVIINKLFFNRKIRVERSEVIEASKKIINELNNFTEQYTEYLEKKWSKATVYLVIYGIYYNKNADEIYKAINNITPTEVSNVCKNPTIATKELNILKGVYDNG